MAFRSWLTLHSLLCPCVVLTAALRHNLCPLTYLSISSALLESRGGGIVEKQLYHWQAGSQCPSKQHCSNLELFPPIPVSSTACSCLWFLLCYCSQQTSSLPPAPSSPLPPAGLSASELQLEPANKIIWKPFSLVRYRMALLRQEWFQCLKFPLKLLRLFIQSRWN